METEPGTQPRRGKFATLELWLVYAITLHTLIVGLLLLFFPAWGTRFGGWETVEPLFFTRQAGIFHVVLVVAYLIEYSRYRGVTLMITAKTIAVFFLSAATLLDDVPWAVPVSAVLDGAMAAVVFLLHRKVVEHRCGT